MTQENTSEDKGTAAVPSRPAGPWRSIVKAVVGLLVLVIVILWSVGIFRTRMSPGRLESQEGITVPDGARVITAKEEAMAPRVDIVGTVSSETKAEINARIPATVKEVFVAAGDSVKEGQPLITLDDRDIAEQVSAAEAQFRQAEKELKRTRQLFDSQASTEQALTSAQSMYDTAKAQLERSKVMRTYAQITSPMNGVVTDCRVVAGDLASPGQPLLAVYDSLRMQLEVPVPMRLLDKLPVGQKVDVTLDRPTRPFQGTVRKVVSEIDPLSRTQLVKIHIESDAGDILPGTFGRIWVPDQARNAIMIPVSAVYSMGQIEMVQVVKDNHIIHRAVRTGQKNGDSIEVLSGISAGDVLVVVPVKEN